MDNQIPNDLNIMSIKNILNDSNTNNNNKTFTQVIYMKSYNLNYNQNSNIIKQRGRPRKIRPSECFICKSNETSEWRTIPIDGISTYVCNACGLRERKIMKNNKYITPQQQYINKMYNN